MIRATLRVSLFRYHMFGADIGTLNVYTELVPSSLIGGVSTLVWAKSRSQGNQWRRGYQTLKNLSSTDALGWRVVFEGIVGQSYRGDIALDDIFLGQNACPPSRTCDFELDLCDFQTVPDNGWTRQQAMNFSNFINEDHTTSTSLGYFAMANQNNAQ